MQLSQLQRLAAIAIALAALACHDSTAPRIPIDGDYDLDAIGGKPLPALSLSFNGVDTYITAMRVHLTAEAPSTFTVAERDSVVYSPSNRGIATSTYGGNLTAGPGASVTFSSNFGTEPIRVAADGFVVKRAAGDMHFRRVQ